MLGRLRLLFLSIAFVAGCAAPAVEDDFEAAEGQVTVDLQISKVSIAGPTDEADQYMLDVTVGRIDETTFQKLHQRFQTKRTEAYDAMKVYKLVDFLPSFVRKTHGKVLVPHATPADASLVAALASREMPTDGKAYVDANCHSVTWQWVNHLQGRGADDAVLTLMDGENLFADTAAFETVDEDALAPGDVYFAKGNGGTDQIDAVLHSGVYLGQGLVFEKGNPGQDYPYRIAYLRDVVAKYRRVDPEVRFVYRRIAPTPVLRTPAEDISLAARRDELGLTDVDERVLARYQMQETFNWETQASDFTLGALMPTAEAAPGVFYAYRPR